MTYDGSIKIDTSVNTNTFNKNMNKFADIAKTALNTVLTSVAAVSAALVGIAAKSVSVGMDFEESMSKVSALSGATGKSLDALSDKAKEIGSNTKYSATQASEALQYMALAGWDTEQMLSGIDGVINLAIASGEDLASVSDIVTDSLTAFGMTAEDTNKFVDILTKTSTKSNTTVGMLGESFKYIAPVCGAMGYSAEDAAIALGLMANSGIKSSQSGTSLRMALTRMTKPTDEAAAAMRKLGISMTDNDGNMLSLMDIMKQLRQKIGGVNTELIDAEGNLRDYDDIINELSKDTNNLTQIEQLKNAALIFGTESMSGMLSIINATEEDFASLTSEVYNYDGACQKVAETMSDNLAGDVASLKSAIEGLEIVISESLTDSLRNAATQGVEYVNRLKDAFKNGGLNEAVNEAGQIFAELIAKAVEYAPKMVDAAIGFIQAFVGAIFEHKSEIIDGAKSIAETLANGLTITNTAYCSYDRNNLGKEIPLSMVEEWQNLSPKTSYPLMKHTAFGYYHNPIANTIDGSKCGMSIFHNAIDMIRLADIQFSRLDWEFESGERAIHVDITAFNSENKVNRLNKRLYKGINIDNGTSDLFQEFSPTLRQSDFIAGLEEYKRNIEFQVGLSYGDISNPATITKTATEIKSAKERKYNTVKAIQENLKDCLKDLTYALAFYNSMATVDYSFNCTFKDSILTDEETERKQDLQDVSVGAMPLYEYRMKWYGEDEKTARAKISDNTDVIE